MRIGKRRPLVVKESTEEGLKAALRQLTRQTRELRTELDSIARHAVRGALEDRPQDVPGFARPSLDELT